MGRNGVKVTTGRVMVYMAGGHVMIASIEDEKLVRCHTWNYGGSKDNNKYVRTNAGRSTPLFHRMVMGNPENKVDHVNGNKLDCRRSNLRYATSTQNNQNQSASTRKHHGVSFNRSCTQNPWCARITVNKKLIVLGYFQNVDAAMAARIEAEKRYFGEFAPKR